MFSEFSVSMFRSLSASTRIMLFPASKNMMPINSDRSSQIEIQKNTANISHWLDKMMVSVFSVTKRVQFELLYLVALNMYVPKTSADVFSLLEIVADKFSAD